MKSGDWPRLIISLLACLAAGFIGSLATMKAIPVWFAGLNKPSFSPPNSIFGPVWTVLYILMAVSAFLVWRQDGGSSGPVKIALIVFAVQLILNILWSVLFFGMRMPGLAFAEILLLWISIIATIILFAKASPVAAWLLAPYILWVSFAAVLNYSLWRLN
jgi:tryptophan-rich sensory protein